MPVVDILMSFRNEERFIKEAMECILRQTLQDYVLYLCDDGSDDRSVEIVLGFNDPRIKLIQHSRSLGLAKSLNELAVLGSSPYIARMDADDMCVPTRLERQYGAIRQREDVGLMSCWYDWILYDGSPYKMPSFPTDEKIPDLLSRGITPVAHGPAIMRREAFEKVGGYRVEVGTVEDIDLYLRLMQAGWTLSIFQEHLYSWRIHPYSTVVSSMQENRDWHRRLFGKAVLQQGGSQDGLREWARRFAADGFYRAALRFLFEAIKCDPFNLKSWKYLCVIILGRAKHDEKPIWDFNRA